MGKVGGKRFAPNSVELNPYNDLIIIMIVQTNNRTQGGTTMNFVKRFVLKCGYDVLNRVPRHDRAVKKRVSQLNRDVVTRRSVKMVQIFRY